MHRASPPCSPPLLPSRFFSITALGAALLAAAWLSGGASRPGAFLIQSVERFAPMVGAGVDQVSLTGHRVTRDADIFDALDLANARSVASLDFAAARARVERLPWIASAEVRSVFPNTLDVRVTERRAFAVWRHDGEDRVIDSDGRILAAVKPGASARLPVVAGAGAASEAKALFKTLAAYPEAARRLAFAERVAGRRWTLHFRAGAAVHFEAGRESASLARVLKRGGRALGLGRDGFLADARAPGRLAVRPAPGDPARASGS